MLINRIGQFINYRELSIDCGQLGYLGEKGRFGNNYVVIFKYLKEEIKIQFEFYILYSFL